MTMVVIVEEFVIATIGLHLYYRAVGRAKERWLYPPSDYSQRT
jgi:hypothetical protein